MFNFCLRALDSKGHDVLVQNDSQESTLGSADYALNPSTVN